MGRFLVGMVTSMAIWAVAELLATSWAPITPCFSLGATPKAQRQVGRTFRGLASTRTAQFQVPEAPVAPTMTTFASLTSTTTRLVVVACSPLPLAPWAVDLALAPWAATHWLTTMTPFDCPLEGAGIELKLAGRCRRSTFHVDPHPEACMISDSDRAAAFSLPLLAASLNLKFRLASQGVGGLLACLCFALYSELSDSNIYVFK